MGEEKGNQNSRVQAADVNTARKRNIFVRIFRFYYEGFRSMTVGKSLWIMILIKLFIMFAILKVFFFPNFLNSRFDTDEEKSDYVLRELTGQNAK